MATAETVASSVERILGALESQGDPSAAAALAALKAQTDAAKPTPVVTETTTPTQAPVSTETVVIRPNGEKYFTRKLGGTTDVDVIRRSAVAGMPVLLYGPPGTGKTALVEAALAPRAAAGETQRELVTVQGSGDTETADFVGSYVQHPDGSYHWVDGPLIRAATANDGKGCALLIDEIALIDPKVMAIVYGLMDGRNELVVTQNPERGVVVAGPDFYVIGACNPNAPGARMSEALISRFLVQVEVISDYKLAAKELAVSQRMVNAAANLAKKRQTGEVSWAPELRELLAFKRAAEIFGEAFAISNLIACAPENDRPVVADAIKRTFGLPTVTALRLG